MGRSRLVMVTMPWLKAVSSTRPKLFLASVAENSGTLAWSLSGLRKEEAVMMVSPWCCCEPF